ncbi:hypothetical protein ACFX15_018486 [Malus domestica]
MHVLALVDASNLLQFLRMSTEPSWFSSVPQIWRDVLRENARKKFEEAQFETDLEVITRSLIGGHDAVQLATYELAEKQRQQILQKRRRPSVRLITLSL